jgi:hypothetical protein
VPNFNRVPKKNMLKVGAKRKKVVKDGAIELK